ncbi:MAG TPA: fatty acid oxidation complex subunit alpha FadJ [Gemmatimonadales bacterium]|jgi:3-hydroxyacyl-CoA dehydrogenase/enoyl-CoA hydratase/3-hydroxybutyryl-CoA epimerase|nr:fatty acid oxidation complex subunit alpha FadJ [Gemmatimonadales bacterium]
MTALGFRIENGTAVVSFDLPGASVNTLSSAVSAEFTALLERLLRDNGVRAIVLISGKPDNFIAGADIEEFVALDSEDEATTLSGEAQAVMDRVASSPKPIIAAIHGACLGGGFELALACQWRIATDHPKTQIGLPETQLGIVPGAGGTQRLPRLVGMRAALDMILAGKSETAPRAFRRGMIDELVPPSILLDAALRAADRLVMLGPARRTRMGGVMALLLDRNPIGRRLVYNKAMHQLLRKTGGNYPAPVAALEVIGTGLERGMQRGLRAEREAFGKLAVSEVSHRLVELFFATTALKKDDGVPPGTVGEVAPVRRIAVVGAGFMGAAIAGTAVVKARVEARLKDADLARVGRGIRNALRILDERLRRRRISRPEHARLASLVSGAADFSGFRRADLVIEAVFEDLQVKRDVLADVETVVTPDTIVASNTSTIPIAEIAEGAQRPQNVLGMHFFSPVEKMPLLEVIPHAGTAPECIVRAVRFGRKMGKTVIVVADHPGFWVNRILLPYLNEAGLLLEEGAPIDLVDSTMTRFGFPVGPVTLLDEVGLDVGLKAGKVMHEKFGVRLEPASILGTMVEAGRLGRKNGTGFYRYADGKKQGVDESVYRLLGVLRRDEMAPTMVQQRLVYAMLNEAAMAAAEGVVRSPRDGDIGAVFGIGFPAFRGGPLRMIDDLGASRVVQMLRSLEASHGPRFHPAEALVRMAEEGGRFY